MIVEQNPNGSWVIRKGDYKRIYYGYSKSSAIKKFTKDLESDTSSKNCSIFNKNQMRGLFTDKFSRNFKCSHCGEELGQGDEYDLMKSHIWSCTGKSAKAFRKAKEKELDNEYQGKASFDEE